MTAALVAIPKPSSSHLPRPGPLAAQTPCSAEPPEHRGRKNTLCHLAAVGQVHSFMLTWDKCSQPRQNPPPPSATPEDTSLPLPTHTTNRICPSEQLALGMLPQKDGLGEEANSPWSLGPTSDTVWSPEWQEKQDLNP